MLSPVFGLRANTLLFVLLLLAPAALLAWLGFAATVPLEAELRRSAQADLVRAASTASSRLPELVAARLQQCTRELEVVAGELARTLPGQGAAAFAAADARCPGIVLLDAAGVPVLPAPPRDLAMPFLAEWNAFCAFERASGTATADAARAFVAGPLRARALAATRAPAAEPLAADFATELADVADDELPAAGPRVVELLLRSTAGRERLRRVPWLLFAVPAIERERARWFAVLGADGYATGQRMRAGEAASAPGAEVVAALPGGARLVRRLDVAVELAQFAVDDAVCAVGLEPAGHAFAAEPQGAAGFALAVATAFGPVRIEVAHRGLPAMLADARRRQWLTGIGVGLLFVTMGIGVALVRRAFVQEAAARALRDRFLANVSHDLKTPLTSLRLHAEMLADAALEPAARGRYAAVVMAEGARMSALIEDLLDVSALQQGRRRIEPEPVDLAAAVRAAADAWRPLLERDGTALRVAVHADAHALADPIALGRILTNLLQNASRHGRPARDRGASWVELSAGPGARLGVRDNGPGVPAELRERIFTRFERAGAQGDGRGLGLALARELATACGGSLRCRDDGSTLFELELPAMPPASPAEHEP